MFIPSPDASLVIFLPGEQMRARVSRVIDPNTVIVEIGQPLTRNHSFRFGDLVACRRRYGELGETWQAIETRAAPVIPEPEASPESEPEPIPVATVAEPARKSARGHR